MTNHARGWGAAPAASCCYQACWMIVGSQAPETGPKSTQSSAAPLLLAVISMAESSCGIWRRKPGRIPHDRRARADVGPLLAVISQGLRGKLMITKTLGCYDDPIPS
jgi:hypothetical protein